MDSFRAYRIWDQREQRTKIIERRWFRQAHEKGCLVWQRHYFPLSLEQCPTLPSQQHPLRWFPLQSVSFKVLKYVLPFSFFALVSRMSMMLLTKWPLLSCSKQILSLLGKILKISTEQISELRSHIEIQLFCKKFGRKSLLAWSQETYQPWKRTSREFASFKKTSHGTNSSTTESKFGLRTETNTLSRTCHWKNIYKNKSSRKSLCRLRVKKFQLNGTSITTDLSLP